MFKNESLSDLKKINQYLNKIESMFLGQLYFWSSHQNGYGVTEEGRVWIYNTLENWATQLKVSKRSVQRCVQSLKSQGFISAKCLSKNKRNRTLFYTINHDIIYGFLQEKICLKKATNKKLDIATNDHLSGHMYIIDNSKQDINKSYKSEKKLSILVEEVPYDSPKPTTVQDMIKIWNEEFSSSRADLTKNLARFLVASFKTKFKSCLKEWRKYLKTLKTSAYLMGEKFKLSIWWVIKFITIDRIRAGEFGVNPNKVIKDLEDFKEQLHQHMESLYESDCCKQVRLDLVKKLSIPIYLSWFSDVSISENNGKYSMHVTNDFTKDYISTNFRQQLEELRLSFFEYHGQYICKTLELMAS